MIRSTFRLTFLALRSIGEYGVPKQAAGKSFVDTHDSVVYPYAASCQYLRRYCSILVDRFRRGRKLVWSQVSRAVARRTSCAPPDSAPVPRKPDVGGIEYVTTCGPLNHGLRLNRDIVTISQTKSERHLHAFAFIKHKDRSTPARPASAEAQSP
jgi:hypothetical protein